MFIAIHRSSDRLVSGADVVDPESIYAETDAYECLLCGEEVTFDRGAERHALFKHRSGKGDCFSRPQNSAVHQLGCEKAIKTACTKLGYDRETVEIESVIRKGGAMTRADVIITDPDPIAIEVYYRSRLCALYRKLDVMLANGYACYIICVVPGKYEPEHTPEKFDRNLQKFGPVEVGRFVPEFNKLSFGSRITADVVELKSPDGSGYILSG